MKFVPRELKETADISRGAVSWRRALKNTLKVVLVFVLLYFILGFIAHITASFIPDSWEAEIFAGAVPEGHGGGPEFERAEAIFNKLCKRPGLRELPYHLFLIEAPEPNAVAIPGGGVGVTRGLLEKIGSEIGIATVLGHELGHHQGRHCLKRLGRMILIKGTILLLFGDGGSMVTASTDLAEMQYSRSQERAADEYGLRLIHEVYGDTAGCLEFFEMIQKESTSTDSPWAGLISTHPPPSERIEHLRKLQAELEASKDS